VANLTVTIDDTVLKRARKRALEEGTSVNAIVRERLEAYAGEDEAAAAMREFLEWARTVDAGSGPEGRTWTREDLYDRPVLRDRG
jgi:hypothetical protein